MRPEVYELKRMIIYKVISLKHHTFTKGSITSYGLQHILNEYAALGWTFDKIIDFEAKSIGGGKELFFVVFLKQVNFPNDLYLQIDNQITPNPVSEKEFRQQVINKKINPATLSIKKGDKDWKPLIQTAPEMVEIIETLQLEQG